MVILPRRGITFVENIKTIILASEMLNIKSLRNISYLIN